MTGNPEDYELFHYGVKGMKWGVRRKREEKSSGPYQPPKTNKPTDRQIRDARKNRERVRSDLTRDRKTYGAGSEQYKAALQRKRDTEATAGKMTKRKKVAVAAYAVVTTDLVTGGTGSTAAVSAVARTARAGHNFMSKPSVKSTMLKTAYKAGSAVYKGRKFVKNLLDPNTVAGQVVQRSIGR